MSSFSAWRTTFSAALFLSCSLAVADVPQLNTKQLNEQAVMANVWVQNSGEYRALSYQAFNLAHLSLDHYLATYTGDKKIAIVVDADETVVNNSAYNAWQIGKDQGYSGKTWQKWMKAEQATAMPGAKAFLNYVKSRGAEVFYITNRSEKGLQATASNLKALGYPFVDDVHMMLKTTTSDKEARRQKVLESYDIALFMGDNLSDFTNEFYQQGFEQAAHAVDKNKALFGTKYIMLPNPMYGDWEGKVYDENWSLSPQQKSNARKAALKPWSGE
ncbi:5'-nucleotidase, lipoprotein e(P4) family [Neptunicella marina]|uniref:5'-nucleotidase, lipoprotein e(P4) family n=1 Tax=Neptunicella marina TaxID=2125989 RepID=A0A8J6IU23_9ALTE|nr:5'-nucleotidase, lipoprotein e(P4) family [Neptunicella marina]MBC3766334.1 5'-nucleotidase, lipoprotein e(P4) family [Neptunicella marina]